MTLPLLNSLKDFLPKEYAKLRSLEKKVFQQHAQFAGLTEVEAKVKYCQFCRSLKTYGITFFLVKERIKGKNKLIPRLLGVTKDSVIRLDEKTKEVLKIWPLTSISRWAASLHAFTMDFGEYSPDDCYTAQTSEGEQISQLIAGYVDIITKKQKAKDHPGLLGNEESAMYEENVRAERATIVQHQRLPPATRARPRDVGLINGVVDEMINRQTDDYIQMTGGLVQTNGWSQHHLVADSSEVVDGQSLVNSTVHVGRQMSPDNFMIGGTHIFHYQEMSPAQRSLLHTIDEDVEVLQAAKEQLHLRPGDDDVIFGVGSDETSRRWLSESMGASQAKVTDEMGAMNAAVAQALRSANRADSAYTTGQPGLGGSSDPGDDLMMMQQSFRVVTIHFPAFVDDVKRVAVLRRESGAVQPDRAEESTQNILSAARDVADAFTNLFESARPLAAGQAREEIFDGTSESATRSQVVVTHPSGPVSSSSRKAIIEAASRVGEASNDLLRHVMQEGGDEEFEVNALSLTEEERLYRDQLLSLAKAVANTTASLVVKAKNLATQSSLDPEAQQRVIAAATQTGLCTSQLVACTKVLAPTIHQPSCQQQLSEAAREVSWAVDGVVQASRAAGLASADQPPHLQQPIYTAVTDTETAATEVRDALDQLNSHLQKASAKAYTGDALDNFQLAYENLQQCHHAHDGQRMVAAARRLAQATAQMIADIKAQAELAVDDPDRQSRLFAAAKQLADATTTLIAAAKINAVFLYGCECVPISPLLFYSPLVVFLLERVCVCVSDPLEHEDLFCLKWLPFLFTLVCSGNPEDTSLQGQLRESAEQLNGIAYSAAAELLHNRMIRNLQTAARAAVTGATQLVNVSQVAAKRSRGNTYQVGADGKLVNGLIPRTVISIRDSRANPDDPMTQMELISACDRFVLPCEALVRSSRSIAPTVTDPTTQAALDDSTAQLSSAVDVLRTCLARLSPLSRHLQVEGALARLARLATEAATIESSLKQGTLAPLPDEKVDDCFNLLSTSVQDASSSARELQSIIHGLVDQQPDVVNRSDICGLPAVMLASAIAGLVQATRGVVARPEENGAAVIQRDVRGSSLGPAIESARLSVTQDTRQAVQLAYELVKAASDARVACDDNQKATLSTVLSHSEQLTNQLLDTLARCLRGLPGHREISEASHLIEQRREDLIQLSRSAPTRTVRWVEPVVYEQTQSDLTRAAVEFNQATGDLLSSFSPGAFRRTTRRFSGAYDYLTDKGVELSSVAPSSGDPSLQEPQTINKDLVDGLVNVSNHSHALMNEASRVCARPEEQDLRGRFQSAARDVTESISQLLVICTSGVTPDQRECELALRRLDALRPLLENPNRPVNDQNYYECVDAVAKSLAPLADSLRNMSNAIREKQNQDFGSAVRQCANSVCQLVEETAQAAYIIGLADPRSEPGRPSLVNTQLFIRTQRDIQQVCDAICDPTITNRQVIALSTEMARSAKVLCEACSTVSAQTTNSEARQELNTLTRETMQGITALIQHRGSISNMDSGTDLSGDWVSEANRQTTLANARAVSLHVARLVHLVTQGPQFVGQAARVTNEAREAQQPVCSAGLASLNAAQAVLRAAQTLSTNARSGHADSAYLSFSTTSKELSESIKTLAAAMRHVQSETKAYLAPLDLDHAPGQRECQSALDNIARLMQDLQRAKMASMEDHLQPHRELNEEGFQKQLATSVRAVLDSTPNLGHAARSEAEQLGHAVRAVNSYLPGLTASAIAAASRSPLPSTQLVYLEHTSAILEAADQLITVARDAGGNPRAVHLHQTLDESVRGLMDSCEDLLTALDDIASRQGHVSTLIDTLNRSIAQTEEIIQVSVDARFADYQARLLRIARHMEQLNQAIQLRARQPSSESELTPLAHTLTQEYQEMCQTCKGAAATLPNAHQADALRSAVRAVGQASASLVQATAAGRLRGSADPQHVGQQILTLSHSRGVADLDKRAECLDTKLRELINLLDTQGPNTQACLQSASTVSGIIADLDTTILFASSGTLHAPIHDDVDALLGPDDYRRPQYALTSTGEAITDRAGRLDSRLNTDYVTEGFAPIRESIVRTARALMDDTQSLVSGTGEDQTRLASTAHVAVERVTQLADVVKRGAVVIGPGQPDTQVDLLSSCRDVATGLRNVLQAASRTPGCRSPTDPVHNEVRTNAQLTLSSVGTLLQKVKAIEDDERRGIQALTLAAKHCREQAKQLNSVREPGSVLLTPGSSRKSAPSVTNISALSGSSSLIARYLAPDDLARAASGPLQAAVSKAILASTTQTQRDVLNTASTTRDVVTDLVAATKSLLRYSEAPNETRNACAVSSKALAEEFAALLDALKATLFPDNKPSDRERIANAARRIADLSHTLLSLLDNLRDCHNNHRTISAVQYRTDFVDGNSTAMQRSRILVRVRGWSCTSVRVVQNTLSTPIECMHVVSIPKIALCVLILLTTLRWHVHKPRTWLSRVIWCQASVFSALPLFLVGYREDSYVDTSFSGRDVAEKYIGRHVAYHHHYVPNYAIAGPGSTHHSSYVRPTCYPLRMRRGVVGELNNEDQLDEESESRIDASIEQISATLNASKPSKDGASLLRTAHSVATATRNLIRTAKSIGLAPPLDAAERARWASDSKQRNSVSCSLWRAELTLALATQDMCHLAELCSQAHTEDPQPDSTDVFGTSLHLVPSKERLLAAVRRVAAASAQLLMSAKSKRLMCVTEDIQKLQAAGQVVKETTDRLSSSLQQGHFSCDPSGLYVTAPLSPTLQNVIDTQTQIRSHQSELDALEQHLAQLHQEQIRSHPALFDQPSTVTNLV
ncbi:talin [Paragonimus westermani]|uniref:Talin n=1 Tax=Paragonimus westermani TaxID=34504 RepID=A0A5J4NT58_9TREM|nr:talin [Paragonimus westermani]